MQSYSAKQLRVLLGTILLMMAYALVHNSVGYFVAPVTEALGIQRSAFTLYYTILQLTSIAIIPASTRIIERTAHKKLLLAGALWGAVGFAGFSFCRTVWMFYLFGIWLGIAATGCTCLIAVFIIYDWFGEESGTAMGITMAGTGICGILQGLLLPRLIEFLGWQTTYLLIALFWVGALTLAAILAGNRPDQPATPAEQSSAGKETGGRVGWSPSLIAFTLAILVFALHGSFLHHMQAHFAQQGIPPAMVGIFMSIFNVFVITFKISQGIMFDRFSPTITTTLVLCAFAAGLFLAIFANPVVLFISLAMLAFGMSGETVLTPLLTRRIFGSEHYGVTYGRVSMAYNIGTAFSSPIWGAVYDASGSYLPGLWITPLILLADAALILYLMKKKSRI